MHNLSLHYTFYADNSGVSFTFWWTNRYQKLKCFQKILSSIVLHVMFTPPSVLTQYEQAKYEYITYNTAKSLVVLHS